MSRAYIDVIHDIAAINAALAQATDDERPELEAHLRELRGELATSFGPTG